ncbi:MAG: zinc ribbon domain-containing protein [Anaerolineaceae bacterium]|nr:zinc ribbon domain-containing protein [Anaerolineaceae bacterium]
MTIDPSILSTSILISTALAAAFTAALWLSLIIWTYRDMRSRTRDPLLRVLAALVTFVLFLPGIIIYLILRPPRTIEDDYQKTLEEEALLQTIEDNPLCPGCGRRIRHDWIACPNCHTRLKKMCPQCSQPIELPWNLCPWCGTPTPGARREDNLMEGALPGFTDDSKE